MRFQTTARTFVRSRSFLLLLLASILVLVGFAVYAKPPTPKTSHKKLVQSRTRNKRRRFARLVPPVIPLQTIPISVKRSGPVLRAADDDEDPDVHKRTGAIYSINILSSSMDPNNKSVVVAFDTVDCTLAAVQGGNCTVHQIGNDWVLTVSRINPNKPVTNIKFKLTPTATATEPATLYVVGKRDFVYASISFRAMN